MWNSFTESVKANLTTLADSTSRMYSRLSAYPEEVTCSRAGCGHVIPVPVSTFNWRCPHGHMTVPERAACTTPGCGAPRGNHTPTIVCPACSEVVIVPTTTFERNLREGARAAPDAVSHAANTAVKEVKSLAKPPSTFPCYFCQSKLTVPTGPWVCALNGCGCENTSAATQCASCAADRYALGVLCGVCGRPTPVPANKITVELSSAVSTAIAGSVRTMNYVTNTPYVQCPTCTAPHYPSQEDLRALGADDEIVAAASPAGANSPAPGAAGASAGAAAAAGAAPAGSAPAGAAPASSAPAGSAPAPASVSSVSCGCSNCLSRYSFGLGDVTLRTKPSAKEQAAAAEAAANAAAAHAARNEFPGTNEHACYQCREPLSDFFSKIICNECGHAFCRAHTPFTRNHMPCCTPCAEKADSNRTNGAAGYNAPAASGGDAPAAVGAAAASASAPMSDERPPAAALSPVEGTISKASASAAPALSDEAASAIVSDADPSGIELDLN